MSENTDKRTATQKIDDLEKVVTMLYTTVAQIKNATENLIRSQGDMVLVKDALKLLNKKTEAIILSATAETGINVDAVSALVVKMNVEDLKNQVAEYVKNGHLAPADETAANSYVVCEELNLDGTLANPRIQFRLDSQDATTTGLLVGKKVGDTVSFGEGKFSAKILEIYTITEPKAPEAAAPVAATDSAPATEASAPTPALDPLPAETPVVQFVPSDSSTMQTA